MSARFVSPNDMFAAAKSQMLEGREPETEKDWMLIVNFVASNITAGLEVQVCKMFKLMYSIPLNDATIESIAKFQARRK